MAYRILWSDSALDRTVEFFDFIAEDNPAAGSYVVIYRVKKARKKIDIVAVRHSRQRSLPQEEEGPS